jgi:hypothetical protein
LAFPVYLDADVHPIVARILRGRGFDTVSANEAGYRQASDREQLDFAVARRRAREGRAHCGIIVSDQLEVGEVVRRLTKVLGAYSASDMIDRFVWLQSFA